MFRLRRNRLDHLHLESMLRAHRREPSQVFVAAVTADVRRASSQALSAWGRVGLALALTALMLVAVASFGGVGYARSAAKVHLTKLHRVHVSTSAAQAQYGPFTPPKVKKKATSAMTEKTAAGPAQTSPSSTLPFTGLALWMPAAAGLLLIALGLVLRTRSRRRST